MKTLSLDDIQLEMEVGNMTPAQAADLMIIVSAKYGRACDAYVQKDAEYAREFHKLRPDMKSVAETERALDCKELGIERQFWKYQTKKAEMMMKALNTLVYLRTAEAKSQV
jgi:hypothetical protein